MHTYHPGVLTCFANAIFPTPSPENLNHVPVGGLGQRQLGKGHPSECNMHPGNGHLLWGDCPGLAPKWTALPEKSHLSTLSLLGSPYHLYSNCLSVWQTDQYIALGVVWRNEIMHACFPQQVLVYRKHWQLMYVQCETVCLAPIIQLSRHSLSTSCVLWKGTQDKENVIAPLKGTQSPVRQITQKIYWQQWKRKMFP